MQTPTHGGAVVSMSNGKKGLFCFFSVRHFVFSLCMCSLVQQLRFPPTAQRHVCWVRSKLLIICRYERECGRLLQPCDKLATYTQCNSAFTPRQLGRLRQPGETEQGLSSGWKMGERTNINAHTSSELWSSFRIAGLTLCFVECRFLFPFSLCVMLSSETFGKLFSNVLLSFSHQKSLWDSWVFVLCLDLRGHYQFSNLEKQQLFFASTTLCVQNSLPDWQAWDVITRSLPQSPPRLIS